MQLLRGRTAGIAELAVSPDSRYVAAGGTGCDVWDLHAARPRAKRLTGEYAYRVNFAGPSALLVGAGWPLRCSVHDLATGGRTEITGAGGNPASTAVARPADGLLKAATYLGDSETLMTMGRVTGGVFAAVAGPQSAPGLFAPRAFHPRENRYLASVGAGRSLYVLCDVATDEPGVTFAVDHFAVTPDFGSDGERLFLAHLFGIDGYDCATGGDPVVSLARPEGSDPGVIAFHPAGRLCATAEGAGGVTFRDAATLEVLRVYDFAMPRVNAVAFTPDGTRCVIGNSRGKVLVFDVDE